MGLFLKILLTKAIFYLKGLHSVKIIGHGLFCASLGFRNFWPPLPLRFAVQKYPPLVVSSP